MPLCWTPKTDESDPLEIAGAFMDKIKHLGANEHNTRLKVTRAEGGRTSYIIWRGLVKNESYGNYE